MGYAAPRRRGHLATMLLVASLHAAVAYFVLTQRLVQVPPPSEALAVFEVSEVVPKPPPEEPRPAKARTRRSEGAASAANRRSKATPVVVPQPMVRLEVPPPIVAAPVAGAGSDASAGAADIEGPGTGSGGEGVGTGSGLQGGGSGAGGSSARWIKGRIKDSDYPREASEAKAGGTVVVHFDVRTDGRVHNCRVISSSGNLALDQTTCRLIEKRFRYKPATDARGRPVPDVAGWRQDWWLEPRD